MAEHARHGTRNRGRQNNNKKKGKAVIWIAIIAVVAVGAVFFATNFHEDNKNKVQKIAYPQKYSEYVDKAAKDYNLDPALIYAVIHTESGFNPNAESPVGARGLMQVMPDSFDWLMDLRGESEKYTADDLFDPAVCIDYGCYLLRYNLDWFDQNEICAVAGYNAGFGKVDEWLKDSTYSSDGKTLDDPENIPIEETRDYVSRVEDTKQHYKELYY
ncbi:MAG: lytic transglycosylase domain-containing protein [Ruminococcus sp.]|nr:lytic transglycosylase domain-containing protein [Ruminococcus sp.]